MVKNSLQPSALGQSQALALQQFSLNPLPDFADDKAYEEQIKVLFQKKSSLLILITAKENSLIDIENAITCDERELNTGGKIIYSLSLMYMWAQALKDSKLEGYYPLLKQIHTQAIKIGEVYQGLKTHEDFNSVPESKILNLITYINKHCASVTEPNIPLKQETAVKEQPSSLLTKQPLPQKYNPPPSTSAEEIINTKKSPLTQVDLLIQEFDKAKVKYYKEGDWQTSLPIFDKVIKSPIANPENSNEAKGIIIKVSMYNRQSNQDQLQEAKQYCEDIINSSSIRKLRVEAFMNAGKLICYYLNDKDYSAAKSFFTQGLTELASCPDVDSDGSLRYDGLLGKVKSYAGIEPKTESIPPEIIKACNELLQYHPDDSEGLLQRSKAAVYYVQTPELVNQAIEDLKKISPKALKTEAAFVKAKAYECLKNFPAAKNALDSLKQQYPDYPSLGYAQGINDLEKTIAAKLGEPSKISGTDIDYI